MVPVVFVQPRAATTKIQKYGDPPPPHPPFLADRPRTTEPMPGPPPPRAGRPEPPPHADPHAKPPPEAFPITPNNYYLCADNNISYTTMQLFYAPEIDPPLYTLGEEESKHCVRVLRMGAGDTLHLTDGRGNLYRARIVEAAAKRCTVEVVQTTPDYGRLPYGLTMAVAPTKNIDRFEWFLEKAVEVGVTRIVPLLCDHSERRSINPERAQRIIVAAMKQSLKAFLPQLDPMTPFRTLVTGTTAPARLIAHCAETPEPKAYLPRAVGKGAENVILIGPEGDFSPGEISFALENRFVAVTLGQQRLRTETAAVAATIMTSVANTL